MILECPGCYVGWGDMVKIRTCLNPCGSLASPGYGASMLGWEEEVSWDIEVKKGKSIELFFEDFDVGSASADCVESYLKVSFSTYDNRIVHHATYCNKIPPPSILYSKLNYMQLYYKSSKSKSGHGRGFLAHYRDVTNQISSKFHSQIQFKGVFF